MKLLNRTVSVFADAMSVGAPIDVFMLFFRSIHRLASSVFANEPDQSKPCANDQSGPKSHLLHRRTLLIPFSRIGYMSNTAMIKVQ